MTYQSKTNLAKLKIKSGYMLFLHTDYSLLLEDSLDFKNKVSMKLRAVNLTLPL